MKRLMRAKVGGLAMQVLWGALSFVFMSATLANNGFTSFYEKYSPEKQFPVKENCHVLNTVKNVSDTTISGEYLDRRKTTAGKKGYLRTEHSFKFPDLTLLTMQGNVTTLKQELNSDKPVLLNFIFTTCTTICPVLSASFYQLQNELGEESRDVKMISISIDPEHDTPDKLRSYAERFNAGPQWQFLTGEADDIIAVEKAFGAYRGAKMNHEPLTFIRAGNQTSWIRINGIASAKDILSEYRNLVLR